MKIKIESDVFNIVNRIKEIDNNYFVIYNTNCQKFEIHNSKYKSSYCLTVPYKNLDVRVIDLLHKTAIRNYDKIVKKIEEDNINLQNEQIRKAKEINDYKIREVLKYSRDKTITSTFKSSWV